MSDIKLNITASKITFDDFVKDYGEALPADKMQRIAESVGNVMKETLEHRIEEDVYKEYNPKVYPRRSDPKNSGYGVALNNMEKTVTLYPKPKDHIAGKVVVTFVYQPSGEHSGTFGEFFNEDQLTRLHKKASDPIKPNPVHGDDLIRRIETGRGYDYHPSSKDPHPFTEPRPFWANFVAEMLEGGEFDRAVKSAFAAEGIDIQDVHTERENSDGNY